MFPIIRDLKNKTDFSINNYLIANLVFSCVQNSFFGGLYGCIPLYRYRMNSLFLYTTDAINFV